MSVEEVCFGCDKLLSIDAVDVVKEKGTEKLRDCSEQRNDGKVNLLLGLTSVKVHSKCRKKYTNAKMIIAAAKNGPPPAQPHDEAANEIPQERAIDFDFGNACFVCGDEITDEFLANEQKKPWGKRVAVASIGSVNAAENILKVASESDDEWSTKVLDRIRGMNLVELGAKYHRPCYQKFVLPSRHSTGTIGRPTSDHISSSMDKIFDYIEENKDQCQFTLRELSNLIDDAPSHPTIKLKLMEKYKDDIVIHSEPGRATIVSIRDHFDLLDSWYLKKLPDKQKERDRIVESAGAIILEDVQNKVYDTDNYPSPDKFLDAAEEVVPHTLQLLLKLKSKLLDVGYHVKQHKEDADTLIVYTALEESANYETVIVVGEDVDLLVILTGVAEDKHKNVYFMKPGKGKSATSVFSSNSLKKEELAAHILTCHAFTGCDTTSAFFNQGKTKLTTLVLKDSQIQEAVKCFTVPDAQPDDLDEAGEKILVKMYGGKLPKSLNDLRYEGFARSITKSKYNLCSLPPTKAAARQHSLRVYHQVQQWLGNDLPATSWGWTRGSHGLTPTLTTLEAAPPEVLKLVSCRCAKGCTTAACSCRKSGLKCTLLCLSCHGETCSNSREIELDGLDDDETDAVKNSLLNAENDNFGEPQDAFLDDTSDEAVDLDQLEATNSPEENVGDLDLHTNDSPSGPTTRKKRRLLEDG